MPRETDRDLFPWILGVLLLASGAGAAMVALNGGVKGTPGPPPVADPVASPLPAPPVAGPKPAPELISPPPNAAPASAPVSADTLPPGQVWQCIVNGQRTFSDSPCGAGASIRQLNDVNRMAPAPPVPGSAYARSPPYPDGGGYASELEPPAADDTYAAGAAPVIIANRTPRHDYRPRPHPHEHSGGGAHPRAATR